MALYPKKLSSQEFVEDGHLAALWPFLCGRFGSGQGPDLPFLPRRSPHHGGVPFFFTGRWFMVCRFLFGWRYPSRGTSLISTQFCPAARAEVGTRRDFLPAVLAERGELISFIGNSRLPQIYLPPNPFSILGFRFLTADARYCNGRFTD